MNFMSRSERQRTRITLMQIRLATYIQTVCNVLLLGFSSSEHTTTTAYSALVITSLAVACSLVGVIWKGFLNLAHAWVARSLMTVMMLPPWIISSARPRDPALFLALQVRFMMFSIFILWMTIRCSCAGHDPACNLCVKGYWLGIQCSVCRPISRSFDLAMFLAFMCSWFWTNIWTFGLSHFLAAVPAIFSRRRARMWMENIREHKRLSRPQFTSFMFRGKRRYLQLADWSKTRQVMDEQAEGGENLARYQSKTSQRPSWVTRALDETASAPHAKRIWVTVVALITCALSIFNTEKALEINMVLSTNSWSYGQMFALVATVPSVYSLLRLILRLGRTTEHPICEDCLDGDLCDTIGIRSQYSASAGTGSGTQRWPVYNNLFGRHSW